MGKRKKILLVEDYEANILVAGTFLENFGYAYDVANDGKEALQKYESGDYALILMDIQMYEMDGYETTSRIRTIENNSGKRTPIIAMTAHALAGDREKALSADMDDYLAKPFNPLELKEMLEKYVKENDGHSAVA